MVTTAPNQAALSTTRAAWYNTDPKGSTLKEERTEVEKCTDATYQRWNRTSK